MHTYLEVATLSVKQLPLPPHTHTRTFSYVPYPTPPHTHTHTHIHTPTHTCTKHIWLPHVCPCFQQHIHSLKTAAWLPEIGWEKKTQMVSARNKHNKTFISKFHTLLFFESCQYFSFLCKKNNTPRLTKESQVRFCMWYLSSNIMYWYLKNNNNKTPAVGICTGKITNKFNCHHGLPSLEGAATSVIYVVTKVLSQQTCVCHDKRMPVVTKVLCLLHIFL